MKPSRRSILSSLDNTLRWTGIPARVADEMSDTPSVDRKHRPIWALLLNATLLGNLPTLYASWNLRPLPKE
jgi:hypothetical protein